MFDLTRVMRSMSILTKNRDFRLIFSATAISNLGDGVSALAFPWLATLITRDPTLIALVAVATRLPWLLFSIPAGVLTDRRDRRTLMVQADVFRFVLTAGVIALILNIGSFPPENAEFFHIAILSGIAFLLGSAEVIRDNAAQTVLPSIVDKSDLERANGQLWSVEQVMGSFVGPPLAGFLIAMSVPAPFLLDAVTFALAAWIVWSMTLPKRATPKRRSIRVEMMEGITWMRGHPIIVQLAIMLGIINALHMATLTILVLFSQDILGLGAAGHGLLLTAAAAGGVLGGLLCPAIAKRLGNRASLLWAMLFFTIPFIMTAMTSSAWIAGLAQFLSMGAGLLWNVVTVSYRQRAIPDELLGRVNSIYRFFGWGMMPVGALCGGLIVSWAEPGLGREDAIRLVFYIAGLGSILMLAYGWARLKIT